MVALRLRELARAQIEVLEGGERHRAGRLDDHLVLFEHEQDHLVDVALGNLDKVVKELVEQREGQVARAAHGHAFGRGDDLVGRHHAACVERLAPCGRAFGDRADHTHVWAECLDRERHARAEAAAAERHHHVGDVGHIFENFHADRALPAQHLVIVERRHVRHAFVLAQFDCVRGGLVEDLAVQHDVGAVRLGGVHLERRGDFRHEDGCFGAALACRIRHALCMVAGGGRDDAALELFVGERGDLVVCAADLERAGDLQVLRLEQDRMTGHLGQHRRGDDLRVLRGSVQTAGGQFQFGGMVMPHCLQHIFLFHKPLL